jgi:hypothetical protein
VRGTYSADEADDKAAYRFLVRIPKRKRLLWRPRFREDDIKMDLIAFIEYTSF